MTKIKFTDEQLARAKEVGLMQMCRELRYTVEAAVLEETRGCQSAAARKLKIMRATLRRDLDVQGLTKRQR